MAREVLPLVCPIFGAEMRIIAFITEASAVTNSGRYMLQDRLITGFLVG